MATPQNPPRPVEKPESSLGNGDGQFDSQLDQLPPSPPQPGPAQPPVTLAFSETQLTSGEKTLRIPGYEILGELGRGGMGIVYKARQLQLGRLVAIKMSRSEEATSEDLSRFRAEAEAVARLRHPNIVQIYEVGEWQGRPFFCFEYVDGGSLADYLRGTPQPPRASAELVEIAARAMHVAHQHGIIHRDLKPANVLLSGTWRTADGEPAATRPKKPDDGPHHETLPLATRNSPLATPKIADFGVAKRLDKHSVHTATGAVLGTPNYMAPEQAWGSDKRRPVGPPTDIYALGAILYEMITGRPPFVGETPLDTLQQVVMQEPVPPTRLQPKVPKDLETICLKCLQKEPVRRYASAEALADDLRSFLEDRPVQAKAAGPLTRLMRWRRRNPAVAALLVITFLLLAAGTSYLTYLTVNLSIAVGKAEENEQKAEDFAQRLKFNLDKLQVTLKEAKDNEALAQERLRERDRLHYGWQISLANRALQEKSLGRVRKLLDSLVPVKADSKDLRGFEWYHLMRRCGKVLTLAAHASQVRAVAFSPDGNIVATACAARDGQGQPANVEISLWNAETGDRVWHMPYAQRGTVNCLAFHPDGKMFASASDDGTLKVWDAAILDGPTVTCKGHEGEVTSVHFSSDGRYLVSSSADKTLRFWDARKGDQTSLPLEMRDAVEWVSPNPSGATIAVAFRDGTISLLEATRYRELHRLSGHAAAVTHLAWDPEGKTLVSASRDHTVCVWDLTKIEIVPLTLRHHTGRVCQVAFSPSGDQIASVSEDKTAQQYDVKNKSAQEIPCDASSELCCLSYSGDGARLAMACADGKLIIWPVGLKAAALALKDHTAEVCDVAWSPDGAMMASCRGDKYGRDKDQKDGSEVILWNPATRKPTHTLTAHLKRVVRAAFQPKGKLLATASHDGVIRLWDPASGEEVKKLTSQDEPFHSLVWSPDGKRLAATCNVEQPGKVMTRVTIWDVATGIRHKEFLDPRDWMDSLAWSQNGELLAGASSASSDVRLWKAETGELVHLFTGHTGPVNALAFSPDNAWLASASADKTVRIWDVREKKESQLLTGHGGDVRAVAFHPSGKRLASASNDKLIKLWDLGTHLEIYSLAEHKEPVAALAFRPDGLQLASASVDGTVCIWDATPLQTGVLKKP